MTVAIWLKNFPNFSIGKKFPEKEWKVKKNIEGNFKKAFKRSEI